MVTRCKWNYFWSVTPNDLIKIIHSTIFMLNPKNAHIPSFDAIQLVQFEFSLFFFHSIPSSIIHEYFLDETKLNLLLVASSIKCFAFFLFHSGDLWLSNWVFYLFNEISLIWISSSSLHIIIIVILLEAINWTAN